MLNILHAFVHTSSYSFDNKILSDKEAIFAFMNTTELVVEIRPVSWTIERYFLMTKTLTRIDHTYY